MMPTEKDLERRKPCAACGRDHGSVNGQILCLERALAESREAYRRMAERAKG
jgi:hypothetical protein